MGTRTKWIKFNNGASHPCMAWGGAFREESMTKINPSGNGVTGISLIAVGNQDLDEFAHTHWGRIPKEEDLAEVFSEQALLLAQDGHVPPEWKADLDDPYEELKTRASQQKLGLLAIMHSQTGNGREAQTAVYGVSQDTATLALNTMSQRLARYALAKRPEEQPVNLQVAA